MISPSGAILTTMRLKQKGKVESFALGMTLGLWRDERTKRSITAIRRGIYNISLRHEVFYFFFFRVKLDRKTLI
jgi:hypothetical protein